MSGVRPVFDRAGYAEERLASALQLEPPLERSAVAANLRRLRPDDPLAVLARLFFAGEPVAREVAQRALSPPGLEQLSRADIIGQSEATLSPRVAVTPWEGLLLAHDLEASPLPRDHVIGVNPATRTLAALTVREPVASALDVGTGCGAQALLAARNAERVVATDINPRALELARLNAQLNGVDNVEWRLGSLFEPLAGERFDLIVTNPPFVVSPDSELTFRDAGLVRDDLSRTIVAELPRHLGDGGFASTLLSWVERPDEDWAEPLREWLEGSECDAWVLRYVTEDAVEYALKWAAPTAVDRWLDYYREHSVERLSTGALVLRKRAGGGRPWFRAADAATAPTGPAGAQLLRAFAGCDLVDSGDLLDERLALAPHRLEETLVWTVERYAPERLVLRLDDGSGAEAEVDVEALPTLFRLDGSRPLRELPNAEAALPTVRRLLELGLLERRDEARSPA